MTDITLPSKADVNAVSGIHGHEYPLRHERPPHLAEITSGGGSITYGATGSEVEAPGDGDVASLDIGVLGSVNRGVFGIELHAEAGGDLDGGIWVGCVSNQTGTEIDSFGINVVNGEIYAGNSLVDTIPFTITNSNHYLQIIGDMQNDKLHVRATNARTDNVFDEEYETSISVVNRSMRVRAVGGVNGLMYSVNWMRTLETAPYEVDL